MTATVNSPFKAPPRMSKAGFIAVLERQGSFGSPALWEPTPQDQRPAEAARIYDYIADNDHDPARWLAILGKESSFGANRNSVLWRNNTRSWTNARSIRHPKVHGEIITDSERRSQYVRYRNVFDSVRDGIYRVDDPAFAYTDAHTIAEVMAIFAPASDANDPEGYARTMVRWINAWATEFPVGEEGDAMRAQIPGFQWRPAQPSHYQQGRTQTIRGYAQHYTAGTDSLGWLTGDSRPPVSATFLIKHNPTLDDRGWQLTRIEDTAWTTASANPFTVSCEYEHTGFGSIPDAAYEVMAQTIIDTAAYVERHGLGVIPLSREGIKGHREWVNGGTICPDGIDMDYLVARVRRQKGQDDMDGDIEVNGITLIGGFKGRWTSLGPMALPTLGLPLTGEFQATVDGVERTVQIFERSVLGWFPEGKPHGVPPEDPMHVRSLTVSEAIAVRQWAHDAGIL